MRETKPNNVIKIIGGPTASGKSALAMTVAREHDSVIINADSMQIYGDLPILTAQPSTEDRQIIPHHLYGTLHPNDACSAGNWREYVIPIIHETLHQGRMPIIVGGSGLYIKALIEGLSPIPDIPGDIRESAVQKQQALGNPAFHAALQKRDPIMAERFHPEHTARLIRAWEVLEATGKSLSEWQKLPLEKPPEDWRFDVTLVMPERDVLYERCNIRFVQMLENGALEETESFSKKTLSGAYNNNIPLRNALGYEQLRDYTTGKLSKDDAITLAQGETRRYAKRQVTWFRHQVKESESVVNLNMINQPEN